MPATVAAMGRSHNHNSHNHIESFANAASAAS
jgi:hypothetical protein